jgi:hypothetical protein
MKPTQRRQREKAASTLTPQNFRILQMYAALPNSAVVPVPVAAAVKGISDKTVRRTYRLISVSDGRVGVRKEALEADTEHPLNAA